MSTIIDKVRDYIKECPYLNEYAELNINYLVDKVETYSINENSGYDPKINKFINGNSERQFLFTFDSRLRWNEDIQKNINNTEFYENFKEWLEENNKNKVFPEVDGIYEIGATTNGYIFITNANEAIYRIQCYLNYYKN